MKLFRSMKRYIFGGGGGRQKKQSLEKRKEFQRLDCDTLNNWINAIWNNTSAANNRVEISDYLDYMVINRQSTVDVSSRLSRNVQDYLLYSALEFDIWYGDVFYALFDLELKRVINRMSDLQPVHKALENGTQDIKFFLDRYISINAHFRGDLKKQEVFIVQLVNMVAENIENVRMHPKFYHTFRRKMREFEAQGEFCIPWLEEFMRIQDKFMSSLQ